MGCNTPHTFAGLIFYVVITAVHRLKLPATSHEPVGINDYRKDFVVMLSTARKMAAQVNREAQR